MRNDMTLKPLYQLHDLIINIFITYSIILGSAAANIKPNTASTESQALVVQRKELDKHRSRHNYTPFCLYLVAGADVMESNAPYKTNFENQIKNTIQFNQSKAFPTFSFICNAYNISWQQHLQSTNQVVKPVGSAFLPEALLSSTALGDNFDVSIFLTSVNESDW
ncbi:hypothetical protein PGT21_011642 [Puccinia graminis f. sp. tritici]|uniref:Uncharacterized protein n=1 Tax=Puccinia graminis f. sp. tritici TaxID=56615 RepID=A0A5B0MF06_PUCGR|nr:hypothetical protein PGT21_011642 [Puccinia graminis f. sp. tritici]